MRSWILERYQVYARVSALIAIFLSPVLFHRKTQDVFNLLKFTTIWVFGLSALVFFLMWSAERGIWPPRFRIALFSLPFLGACVLATVFSTNPTLSLIGLYHRYGGLIPFTLYAIVMFVIASIYWEKPQDLRDIAKCATAAAVPLAAYVLIQAAKQDWIPWQDPGGGPPEFPVGTMGNSNFAGAFLGISLPFVVYAVLTAKHEALRVAGFAILAADLLALWFTQTRGGMIAAGVGLVVMAVAYRDKVPRWVRVATLIAVTMAVIVAVMVLWHPGFDAPPGPLGKMKAFRTGTFEIRTFYWTTALRIFQENPIIGVGLERYYANYPRYRLPEDGAQLGLTITDKPHNIFLEYLANAGIVGLGTYLLFIGVALWYGYRRARDPDEPHRALLVAFLAVLAGYLAQGFFSIDVPPLAFMGWYSVAGIAAIADPRARSRREALAAAQREQRPKGKKARVAAGLARVSSPVARYGGTRWAFHVPITIVAVLLYLVGLRPLLADVKAKDATVQETASASYEQVTQTYREAIQLHPLESAYRAQLGAHAFTKARGADDRAQKERFLRDAIKYYQEALALQDGNVFFLIAIADAYSHWAETTDPAKFPLAEKWWKRAVEQDPRDYVVRERYAVLLINYSNSLQTNNEGMRRRSAAELEVVLSMRPDLVNDWVNLSKVYRALGENAKARRALEEALKRDPKHSEAITLLASLEP